jgi:hypothetical protein
MRQGRYDAAERRQGQRTGREKGCWVYIPAEELEKTGVTLDGPTPLYRVWGAPRGRVVVQLYKDVAASRVESGDGNSPGETGAADASEAIPARSP